MGGELRGSNGLTHLDDLAVQALSPRRFERLLDAGCGTGLRMPSRTAGLTVGVDLTSEMLSVGQARGETRLINADIRALPVRDRCFDLLWCRLVLSHLADIGAAYDELGRTSARGATLIVTDLYLAPGRATLNTSFTDQSGTTRFIEVFPRAAVDHARIAADAGFDLQETFYSVIGPESRQFFEQAGELPRYERQKGRRILVAMKFGSSHECMQGEQVLSAFKLCRISHLRESAMTRYLRRGCGGLDRRLHLRARGTRSPAFEAVEGSSGRAMAIGASQPRVSPGCMIVTA